MMIKKVKTYGLAMTGLRKIASASKRLTGGYCNEYFQIFYDTSDGSVFYHDHCSCSDYTIYDNPDIVHIMHTNAPVTMQQIADEISEKMKIRQ